MSRLLGVPVVAVKAAEGEGRDELERRGRLGRGKAA